MTLQTQLPSNDPEDRYTYASLLQLSYIRLRIEVPNSLAESFYYNLIRRVNCALRTHIPNKQTAVGGIFLFPENIFIAYYVMESKCTRKASVLFPRLSVGIIIVNRDHVNEHDQEEHFK